MPTITISHKDFCTLIGKKVSIEELRKLFEYAKAEIDTVSGDDLSIKFNDTNQPYLWSAEGLALLSKGILGKEKGIPPLKLKHSSNKIIVDKSVQTVRPFITAFTAHGVKITDYLLKQIIQLQEKLCDNYGRRREKIAIGVYPAHQIAFPVTYKAVSPSAVRFIPLGEHEPMTLQDILEKHPKGKEYGWILAGHKTYPLLIDAAHHVLSFPPIINSHTIGKLAVGDDTIFFEATGTNESAVNLAALIFAYALQLRGFILSTITISTPTKKILTPSQKTTTIKITQEAVTNLLGIELKPTQIKTLLEKARYNVHGMTIEIPPFRQDIMHPHDIIEDIAIMQGYDTISSQPLTVPTIGATLQIIPFINTLRELLVGEGYQEIFSAILSNKITMNTNMRLNEELIEIDNYTSQTYSVLRNSILPTLLDVFSANKHVAYPQKIFEQGTVTKRTGAVIHDEEVLAVACSNSTTTFTDIRQALATQLHLLGFSITLKETEHPSFIPGRTALILVKNQPICILGEVHPAVLTNFGIEMPVVAAELSVTKLFELL